jgi:NAD(P)-dependent dehydrogenase (short-subunit alcohol dehydrogenase family)
MMNTSARDLVSLAGKVAIVAGGSGAIGSAIAVRLLECGARVYSLDRPDRHPPSGVIAIPVDMTSPDQVAAAVSKVDADMHRLDVVVHAAGTTRDGRLWKLSVDDWRTVLSTNLDSAFYLLHAAVPLMRRSGPGSIVFVSSINAERAKVGLTAYAASKAGMNALARTAAREVGGFGIRVNAIAPGWIDTPMTAAVPEEFHQHARQESALGRVGVPDDVARAVVFLASDLSRHVTGQVLRVDGGQLIG